MSWHIHGALSIPTVTSHPSAKCLQITPDGQLCFQTKGAVYILTPDHGINYDTSSTIKSTKQGPNGGAQGWFRTIIPVDAITPYKWPGYSQAWGAVSLGSLDLTIRAVVTSPSNLSAEASCILVILTSNMDLSLWTASRNSLKGEWIQLADLTPFVIDTIATQEASNHTLKAQITSICWTSQVKFDVKPPVVMDSSFLILGSRAGMLNFLRYRLDEAMDHLGSVHITDRWITQLSTSPWVAIEDRSAEIKIAYASDDGAVGIIQVSQCLEDSTQAPFHVHCSLNFSANSDTSTVSGPDKVQVTTLQWIISKDGAHILVFSKPGRLCLWAPEGRNVSWSGLRTFRLLTQKTSTMSSALYPLTGVQYVPQLDMLIISLFDGSIHSLHDISLEPGWHADTSNPPVEGITTEALSNYARQIAAEIEGTALEHQDANCILGFTSYDLDSSFIWTQEIAHPADFSYKHDAKQKSTLVTGRLWKEPSDEWLLGYIASVLNLSEHPLAAAPIQLLRPILFHVSQQERLSRIRSTLLNLLKPDGHDHTLDIQLPAVDGPVTPEIRSGFRKSLHRHLFGWSQLLSLRLKLAISDCVWKLSSGDLPEQTRCGEIAQSILDVIAHRVLRTIIRHLLAVSNCLTGADVPYVLRIVVQSMLPGLPQDLTAEAEKLTEVVKQRALLEAMGDHGQDAGQVAGNQLNEVCPACKVEVKLQDITRGACPNGHNWARCSVTTFLLSTPRVRTCIGCSRKAFLPLSSSTTNGNSPTNPSPSSSPMETGMSMPGLSINVATGVGTNWLSELAKGWVVEELLEAVHRCLFCGNSFVSIL